MFQDRDEQTKLEMKHRQEEDDLYRKFSKHREEENRRIREEIQVSTKTKVWTKFSSKNQWLTQTSILTGWMGTRTREAHKQVPARDASQEAETRLWDRGTNAAASAGTRGLGEEYDATTGQEEGEFDTEDVRAWKVKVYKVFDKVKWWYRLVGKCRTPFGQVGEICEISVVNTGWGRKTGQSGAS